MHELRCLGEATLRSPSGELIHFRSRKHLALLIYLALNADRAHRRERLAGLLWSDGEDSKARHSLSQALYAVRRLLGDAVRIEGEDLELSPIGLRVDALEMERSLASGNPISAAEFYRGEFLEGFWVRGAKGFEDWAGRERSRLAALARDALRQATKVARDRCDWAEVQQRADRLVQLDPFDEVAYGELMRALWIVGDRAAALERYENLKRVLAAELGSSPSKETDALAERIRERPVRGGWAGQRPCDGEYSIFHNPPFVGRKRELAALAEEWDKVATGETRTVELVGGAGIGKTRLADEFLTSLELSDVLILRSRCYEAEQSLPYGPVAESLRQLVERSDLTEVSPLWLAELARIVPEVHERYGELPEPARLEAEGGRRRLYEGIAQVLRAACEASPVLLLVDDLHWADDSSLALLHYLHRRVTNGLYLLTAHRPEELTARGTAVSADLLAGKSPRVRSIRLEGLDQDESSDLLATLIGDDRDTAALSSVREKSGGNPFFAIELARSMTEQADGDHDGPTIPDSIRTLLDRRFAALSDRAAALMQQAAILGTRSRYETLRAATGLPPLEVDGVLRELTRAGVLTDVGDGLSFRHDLIREVAVAQVPASLTSALHRKAARALIRTKGDPGEIAVHLSAAGDRRRAFRYAVQGADAAEGVYALEEAADLLGLAIAHAPDEATRNDLVGRLGKLHFHMRDYTKARPLLQERLDYVMRNGRPNLEVLESQRDLLFVDVYSSAISLDEAVDSLGALYSYVIEANLDAPMLEADILRSLLWAAARSFNHRLVETTVAKVRGLHARSRQLEVKCRTARSLGIYESYKGRLGLAEDLLYEAQDLAVRANDEAAILDAYIGLTALLLRVMESELANHILEVALPIAEQHADPAVITALLCNVAVCFTYTRELDKAEALLVRARETLESTGDYPDTSPSVLYNFGLLEYTRGNIDLAESYWNQALVASEADGVLPVLVECTASLGTIALLRGQSSTARNLAAQALRLARRGKYLLDQRFGLEELLARLRYGIGRREKALTRLERSASSARESDIPLYLATQLLRTELLLNEGDTKEAARVCEQICIAAQERAATWWLKRAQDLIADVSNQEASKKKIG